MTDGAGKSSKLVGKTPEFTGMKTSFSIEDFCARTKANPGTLEQYRRKLVMLEGWLGKPIADATTQDLARLKRDRLGKISSGYHFADLLKMFYKRMKPKREDLEDVKEILAMDRKKKRLARGDLLTPKEVQAMVDACPGARDKALIGILYETGVRVHELLALDLQDVKVQESPANNGRKLYVMWFKKTKVKGEEHEGYVIEAAKVLEAWLATRRNASATSPLFPSWGGARMAEDGALYVVKRAARNAGIVKRVYCHLLRHSRATWALANGMTDAQVKALFGWTPGSTMLSKYSHIVSRDAKSGLMRTLGLEPEKVEVEQLSFDDDRLMPAIPMIVPPGPRAPPEIPPSLGDFPLEEFVQRVAKSVLDAQPRGLVPWETEQYHSTLEDQRKLRDEIQKLRDELRSELHAVRQDKALRDRIDLVF